MTLSPFHSAWTLNGKAQPGCFQLELQLLYALICAKDLQVIYMRRHSNRLRLDEQSWCCLETLHAVSNHHSSQLVVEVASSSPLARQVEEQLKVRITKPDECGSALGNCEVCVFNVARVEAKIGA